MIVSFECMVTPALYQLRCSGPLQCSQDVHENVQVLQVERKNKIMVTEISAYHAQLQSKNIFLVLCYDFEFKFFPLLRKYLKKKIAHNRIQEHFFYKSQIMNSRKSV